MRARLVLGLLAVAVVCGIGVTRAAHAEQGSITVAVPGGTLSYSVTGSKTLSFEYPTSVPPERAGTKLPLPDWWNYHEQAWVCAQVYFQRTPEGSFDQGTSQRTGYYCKIIDFPPATSDQWDDLRNNIVSGSFDLSELGGSTYCTVSGECMPGYHEIDEGPLAPIDLDPFVGRAVDGAIVMSYCAALRYGSDTGPDSAFTCWGTWRTFSRGMRQTLTDSTVPPVPFSIKVLPSAADCHVPRLVGLKLATATARLKASNCRLGPVARIHTRKAKRGRVAGQGFRPGRWLPRQSRVGLVLSRGHKRPGP